MTLQLLKQRRKLTEQDIARIIEQDISELLCPFFRWDPLIGGYCGRFSADYRSRCANPREYESCAFFTGRWDGL